MKIQYKASLLFFLFSTIFLSIGIFSFDFFSDQEILERAGRSQLSLTDELSRHIESHLEEKSANAMTLANTPLLREALRKSNEEYGKLHNEERKTHINLLNSRWMETDTIQDPFIQSYMNNPVADHLKSHQQLFPEEFGEIFLTNRYGTIIATTKKLTTLAHSHKYWWVASYHNGKGRIFLDDRGFDTSVNGYVLGIVIPIMEKREILGILKCNINILGPISHLIESFNKSNYGVLKLLRSGGLIVIAEGIKPLSIRASEPIIQELRKKIKGVKMIEMDGKTYLVTYAPVPLTLGSKKYGFGGKKESIDHLKGNLGEAWHTLIVREKSDALWTSHESIEFFIKLGIALSLAMAVLAFFIGKLISQPIVAFSETAKKIGQGNLDIEITTRSKDELGILAVSFSEMTKNLKRITTSRDELNKEIKERKQVESQKEDLINKLKNALTEIKTLKGIVPICSSCKKIRDDKGYWNLLESYIEKHSEASFSHGMCPECSDELYGDEDWYIKKKEERQKKKKDN
ncbi:MAG: HAMP domain-containing protein [Bacteroidetes bacterium]|nr:HAMP domain-containing protein [Bacteroidota bacterium]